MSTRTSISTLSGAAYRRLIDVLQEKGCKQSRDGKSWTCPAHDDSHPSLSVAQGREGVLIICRTGCKTEDVIGALGLKLSDLFDSPLSRGRSTPPKRNERPSGSASKVPSKRVEVYNYENTAGDLLRRKVRLEPGSNGRAKSFFWEEQGESGWQKCEGEGNPKILYALPLVSESEIIHVCEGEKAADALNAYFATHSQGDHAATCPPTGKWDSAYTETLRKKRVVLWADRDDAGVDKAQTIYTELVAAEIPVTAVQARAPTAKADAFDHLEQGFQPDDGQPLELSLDAEPAQKSNGAAEALSDDLSAKFEALAELSSVEYDRCRKEEAEGLGIRTSTLDAEVTKLRPKDRDPTSQGLDVIFPDLKPWPEPVDAASWLNCVRAELCRYIVFPKHAAAAVALFSLYTHAVDAFSVSPRLAITSPEKRCAKTMILEMESHLVHRPLAAANITSAAIFRSIDKWGPTLLIDEADTFLRDSDEMRGVLNSGHYRATAYVIRTTGEDHEPRRFSTWGAVVIAMIGSLPGTLEDRSIVIPMRRRRADEHVERFRLDDGAGLSEFARGAARWAADHLDELRAADPDLPEGLHDRARDNWRPLVAIADLAGGAWPKLARDAAVALTPTEDTSRGVQLLEDLRAIFTEQGDSDCIPSGDLVTALLALESRPWLECQRGGRPLTALGLARRLNEFGIKPAQRRSGKTVVRGYRPEDLAEAFERYLPKPPADPVGTSVQSNKNADLHENPVGTESPCVPTGYPANPSESLSCTDVPTGNPGTGREDLEEGVL